MYLLADQEQDLIFSPSSIPFFVFHQHVVVGGNENIDSGVQSGLNQVLVCSGPVGVYGVHVQIYSDFIHV